MSTAMRNTVTIMNDGMNYLLEHLGVVETEIFISQILREPFDYTQWQKNHYARYTVDDLNAEAVEYVNRHPVYSELPENGQPSTKWLSQTIDEAKVQE